MAKTMPRFVIQQHDRQGEPRHWDLMLEHEGGALKTFRLDLPPAELLERAAKAVPISDHPVRFLTYEGPVNKGLGRVQIADRGTYQTLDQGEEAWDLELQGQTLKGGLRLTRSCAGVWEIRRS
ncbi:MAG: hypothetical protein KBE04_07680 [Phycisphaerae bacterium]|nr:hypothetical protein [Phycisphaerae bacterium]